MAAPTIPPIRLGLIGTGLAVEKPRWPAVRGLADPSVVTAAFLALAAGHPDRTFVVGENLFYRDDLRYARALLDGGAIGRLHLMAWRHAGRLVPREGSTTATAEDSSTSPMPCGSECGRSAALRSAWPTRWSSGGLSTPRNGRPYRSTPCPARARYRCGGPVARPGCSTGCQDNASAVRRPSPHERPRSAALASLSRRLQCRPVGKRPLDRTREEWSWKTIRTGRGARSSG
jgi:hypothetical protein